MLLRRLRPRDQYGGAQILRDVRRPSRRQVFASAGRCRHGRQRGGVLDGRAVIDGWCRSTQRRHHCDRHPTQGGAQFINALVAVAGGHRQALAHHVAKVFRKAVAAQGLHRLERVAHHARYRLHGHAPRHGEIQQPTNGIDIGPGALRHGTVVGILLDRRKTRLQHRGEGLRHVGNHHARCAKIHQHRTAVGQHHDVVGRHVTVKAALTVQFLEGQQDGVQGFAQPLFRHDLWRGMQDVPQGDAAVVAHRHVSRAVRFEVPEHLHQPRMCEARQHLGFVDETGQSGGKGAALFLRFGLDGAVGSAQCEGKRQVFLQRHHAVQRQVARAVDNAKATFTNHTRDLELAQTCSHRQGGVGYWRGLRGLVHECGFRRAAS